jgi:hypothetical protein
MLVYQRVSIVTYMRNETLLSDVAKQGINSVVQTNWVSASDSR